MITYSRTFSSTSAVQQKYKKKKKKQPEISQTHEHTRLKTTAKTESLLVTLTKSDLKISVVVYVQFTAPQYVQEQGIGPLQRHTNNMQVHRPSRSTQSSRFSNHEWKKNPTGDGPVSPNDDIIIIMKKKFTYVRLFFRYRTFRTPYIHLH